MALVEPLSASTAVAKKQSTLTHLRGLLEVTSLVRGEDDLDAVLEAIARTIAECLGFGTVAVNLYRPAWDDFMVTNVYGNPGAREALLGDARDLASWQPLLDERFLRHGAYLIPHEQFDWFADVATFVPDIEPTDDPDAWHPQDALIVPMRHSAGHLLGILSVDELRAGRRRLDARRRDALSAGDARRRHAALRPPLRDRGLLPAAVPGGPEALFDRPLRLHLAPERPRAVGVEPALARRPARRPRRKDDRRHLGGRARGPAPPAARAPP